MPRTKLLKDQYVVKSNDLIEARYRLSLQESHVILWLLSQIRADDEDFKEHRLNVDEFSKMFDVEIDNQYSKLLSVTKRLTSRSIEIYSSKENKTIQVSWLCSAEYMHGKGYVLLRFAPALKPYLLQLKKKFTKIGIADYLNLKSIHTRRIFELLQQYLPVGKRKISIEDIRSFCGIDENEYGKYNHLKQRVIDHAKDEINAKTDYEVGYKEIKNSRKVIALDWGIKKKTHFEKSQNDKLNDLLSESKKGIIEKLVELGFSRSKAYKFFSSHTEDQIANALAVVLSKVKKGKALNPKALFNSALKKGWSTEIYTVKKQ